VKTTGKDQAREDRIYFEAIADANGPEEQVMGRWAYLDDKIKFPFAAKCRITGTELLGPHANRRLVTAANFGRRYRRGIGGCFAMRRVVQRIPRADDREDSVGLLTQPTPDFPSDAIPGDVAQQVYRKTGGQPFLLQVYGSLLVSRLNEQRRRAAIVEDVNAVEIRAVEWAGPFFQDTYKSAPAAVQTLLGNLAIGKPVGLAPPARRWLTQRYLLTDDDRLAVPLFGAWIQHHGYIEEPGNAMISS